MFKNASSVFAALLASALVALAADTPTTGSSAPSFTAKDQDGKEWKLSDFVGQKTLLLYFYPKDNTPGCTKEACGLRDRMGDLKKSGVEVLGVSFDDAASHKKFIESQHLNFPLLVDSEGQLTEAYGARMKDRKMSRRVSFLIGKDGKIIHVTDNPNAMIHLSEMSEVVEKLGTK